MENMAFNDFIPYVVDFAGMWFLFQNSFHSFLKHRTHRAFMTLNGPTHYPSTVIDQSDFLH